MEQPWRALLSRLPFIKAWLASACTPLQAISGDFSSRHYARWKHPWGQMNKWRQRSRGTTKSLAALLPATCNLPKALNYAQTPKWCKLTDALRPAWLTRPPQHGSAMRINKISIILLVPEVRAADHVVIVTSTARSWRQVCSLCLNMRVDGVMMWSWVCGSSSSEVRRPVISVIARNITLARVQKNPLHRSQ